MADTYSILSEGVRVEEVISQLRAIKVYPAAIKIYDRAMFLANKEETWAMIHGLEIGSYIAQDEYDAHNAKSNA